MLAKAVLNTGDALAIDDDVGTFHMHMPGEEGSPKHQRTLVFVFRMHSVEDCRLFGALAALPGGNPTAVKSESFL